MLKCPKCGSDNMLGAIFCRNCGDKLNLNDLRPMDIPRSKDPHAFSFLKLVYRFFVLALLVGVAGILAMILLPPKSPMVTPTEAEKALAERKFQTLTTLTARSPESAMFTSAEATALAMKKILPDPAKAEGLVLVPERISVEFLASGCISIQVSSNLFGKLPMHSTAVVQIDAGEGGVTATVLKVSAGRLALPGVLAPFISERMLPMFADNGDVKKLKLDIRKVEVTGGSATVTLKSARERIRNATGK